MIHILHITALKHIDKNGKVLWEADEKDLPIGNMLVDEGEQALLSAYFATAMSGFGAPPANLYMGLDTKTPAEADTLVSLTGEPSGSGYARQPISTAGTGVTGQDFYINQPAAYYRADSKDVTFTASGGAWSAVTYMFLCTVVSGTAGKLISELALTASRTLQDGDSLVASINVGMSE